MIVIISSLLSSVHDSEEETVIIHTGLGPGILSRGSRRFSSCCDMDDTVIMITFIRKNYCFFFTKNEDYHNHEQVLFFLFSIR